MSPVHQTFYLLRCIMSIIKLCTVHKQHSTSHLSSHNKLPSVQPISVDPPDPCNNNNNNNNNTWDNVYGAAIMTEVIAKVHPEHLTNAGQGQPTWAVISPVGSMDYIHLHTFIPSGVSGLNHPALRPQFGPNCPGLHMTSPFIITHYRIHSHTHT